MKTNQNHSPLNIETMYSHPSSSSSYSSSSNSNSPPVEIFYGVPNQMVYNGGYGTTPPPMDMSMNHQMNYHHFPQDNNLMTNQQFGANAMQENNGFQYYGFNQQFQNMDHQMVHGMNQFQNQNYNFFGNNENQIQNPGFDMTLHQNATEFKFEVPKQKRKSSKNKIKKVSTMHLNTSCSNCGCRETRLWRRNEKGEPECNPCNLYERCNGQKRPAHLWNRPSAQRRRRPVAAPLANANLNGLDN